MNGKRHFSKYNRCSKKHPAPSTHVSVKRVGCNSQPLCINSEPRSVIFYPLCVLGWWFRLSPPPHPTHFSLKRVNNNSQPLCVNSEPLSFNPAPPSTQRRPELAVNGKRPLQTLCFCFAFCFLCSSCGSFCYSFMLQDHEKTQSRDLGNHDVQVFYASRPSKNTK